MRSPYAAAVPDQTPPRGLDDERETLLSLLQFQRDSLVRKVAGVSEGDARQSPVASGTTLLWLVKHLCFAESLWVERRFAGFDVAFSGDAVEVEGDTLDAAVAEYRATWDRVGAIVAGAGLDDPCRDAADPLGPTNLRWVLAHLLEETARHAGHADILRELIDGSTGR
jgi:Protein of unknown function (DUF664)